MNKKYNFNQHVYKCDRCFSDYVVNGLPLTDRTPRLCHKCVKPVPVVVK